MSYSWKTTGDISFNDANFAGAYTNLGDEFLLSASGEFATLEASIVSGISSGWLSSGATIANLFSQIIDEVDILSAASASNQGLGQGLYKQKTGVDLEFYTLGPGSTKVTIGSPVADIIPIDIVEANIVHDNLSGHGTNTHTQIDSHISDATIHFTVGSIDHGSLNAASLLDDDHTQYVLATGTRAFTGVVGGITPTLDTHLATKGYVDTLAEGLHPKAAVRVATTTTLPAYTKTGTGVGAYLEANANGTINSPGIDGITDLAVGDRILVKNENGTGSDVDNGVYGVTTVGDVGTPWKITRTTDFDGNPSTEVQGGDFMFVQEGTANADSGWVLITDGTITVDTTALTFSQFSGAGQFTAGTGLTKSGNTINIGDGSTGNINGINIAADAISAAVDDSTIEISANVLAIKDWTLQNAYDSTSGNTIVLDGTNNFEVQSQAAGDYVRFSEGDATTDLDMTAVVEDWSVTASGGYSVSATGTVGLTSGAGSSMALTSGKALTVDADTGLSLYGSSISIGGTGANIAPTIVVQSIQTGTGALATDPNITINAEAQGGAAGDDAVITIIADASGSGASTLYLGRNTGTDVTDDIYMGGVSGTVQIGQGGGTDTNEVFIYGAGTGIGLTLATKNSGDLSIASAGDIVNSASGGDITFADQYWDGTTDPIPLSDSASHNFSGFTTTPLSLVHAINLAYNNGGSVDTLQATYEAGSTISTNVTGTNLDFTVTTNGDFRVFNGTDHVNFEYSAANALDVDATVNVYSIDATAASNFTVTGAALTLSTVTSGNVIIDSAATLDVDAVAVTIDATSGISLDAAAASNFTVDSANLTLATTTSGDILVNAVDALTVAAGAASGITVAADFGITTTGTGDVNITSAADINFAVGGEFNFGAEAEANWATSIALSGGQLAAAGDSQTGITHLRAHTTTGSSTDYLTPDAAGTLSLEVTKAYSCSCVVVAKQNAGTAVAGWNIEFLVLGGATSGGAPTLVTGSTNVNKFGEQGNADDWDVTISVATEAGTGGELRITCNGTADENIEWTGTLITSEALVASA